MNLHESLNKLLRQNDAEIYLRDLDSLINEYGGILHGFKDKQAADYLVTGLLLFKSRRDLMTFTAGYAYIADFSLKPLLACYKFAEFDDDIDRLYDYFVEILSDTAYAPENVVYLEAREMAKQGSEFNGKVLPPELMVRLAR